MRLWKHSGQQVILLLTFLIPKCVTQEISYTPNRNPSILLNRNGEGPPLNDIDLYSDIPRNHYIYPDIEQNDIGFITPEDDEYIQGEIMNYGRPNGYEFEQYPPQDYMGRTRNKSYKKVILDMLDDNDIDVPDERKKRVLSSFRERREGEETKNQKLFAQFLKQLVDEQERREQDVSRSNYPDHEYMKELRELLYKNMYKNSHNYQNDPMIKKRQFPNEYPSLGWSGVGVYRKRESPGNYELANEALYKLMDDDDRKRARRVDWREEQPMPYAILDDPNPNYLLGNQDYVYVKRKRNAVTKRSSNYYNHHKRYANKDLRKKALIKKEHQLSGTDPKILKDLQNIFGNDNKTEEKKENQPHQEMKEGIQNEMNKDTDEKDDTRDDTKENIKEEMKEKMKKEILKQEILKHEMLKQDMKKQEKKNPVKKEDNVDDKKKRNQEKEQIVEDKNDRLNIKKKSLDWSNYFGYDRKKKSSHQNEINEEWLMDRYRKAAAAAKKRQDYPLKFFRNHDEVKRNGDDDDDKKEESNDTKLSEMDGRLKYIEDLIIDEALKYTGAHEGATDTKEIQEVKDNVISRLAAAYSLEKMRRALSEFKTSISAQRYAMKYNEDQTDDDLDEKKRDDKRVVKKKSYDEDEKRSDKDEIDEIDEYQIDQNPSGMNNITEDRRVVHLSVVGGLEIFERRCRNILPADRNEHMFPLCKWHQICYLCSPDNPEAYATCDSIFQSKAYDGCRNDLICQWAVRPQLDLLRDSLRSINLDQFDKSICNIDPYAENEYEFDPNNNHIQNGLKIRRYAPEY